MIIDELEGEWVGSLRGTLVSELYVVFTRTGDRLNVRLKANSNGRGIELRGPARLADGAIVAKVTQSAKGLPEGSAPISATLRFESASAERASGRWTTTDGNEGVFALFPALPGATGQAPAGADQPTRMQIVTQQQVLPKMRLSRADLIEMVEAMKLCVVTENDVVINAEIDGNEIVSFAADFFSRADLPRELGSVRLTLNNAPNSSTKSVQLNLVPLGCNFVVSGNDEVWVNGTALLFEKALRRRYSRTTALFQRHGLNLNFIAFLVAFGFAPDLPTVSRFVFLAAVVAGIFAFKAIHDRINRVRVFPRADTSDAPWRWAKLVDPVVAAALSVLVAGVFAFLASGGLAEIAASLSAWLGSMGG